MPDVDQWIGLGVTVLGGSAGLWLIIRWMVHYQRDFTGVYRSDLIEARQEIQRIAKDRDFLDNETDELTISLRACQMERAAMRAFIIEKGLSWNPIDWGLHDHKR